MDKKRQDLINELLDKGVENIYPNREFLEKKLTSGKKLKIYLGIDPTGPNLHVGHSIPLRKLRQFQNLGHEVILLIGNFTALCGDPDKSHTRTRLTSKEINANLKNYKKQISMLLNTRGKNKAKFKFNYDWLSKLNFKDLIEIASNFTVQQMLARDLFARRIKNENPILLHEFLYPLMQAYDSVAMDVDGEIGGNDQTFNMLAGRDLMKAMRNKEKFVITLKLLADPTGKKMGKTEGNMITMADSAQDMYGKVMSWPDTMITIGFELLTNLSLMEIKKIEEKLSSDSINPRDLKDQLAQKIVSEYFSSKEALRAATEFKNIFQKHKNPNDLPEIKIADRQYNIIELIAATKLTSSNSESRRLIQQNAVKLNDQVINDPKTNISPASNSILKIGKRKFVKLIK